MIKKYLAFGGLPIEVIVAFKLFNVPTLDHVHVYGPRYQHKKNELKKFKNKIAIFFTNVGFLMVF